MKKCFKCNEEKELNEFYKHTRMSDGHVNKCKECNKKDVTENRLLKVEHYRAYDIKRGSRRTAEDTRKYRELNPKKYKAHCIVGNSIRKGALIPLPCQVCDSQEVHGHHCDYDKPLDVIWLCAEHHAAWHSEHGEGLNSV